MEDWEDLLQPKLEGRVAWTDSPREFVAQPCKHLECTSTALLQT